MLIMFITFRAGIHTNIDPPRLTTLTGGNDLIAVVKHDLLSFRGLVSLFYIVFHNNTLHYIGFNYL